MNLLVQGLLLIAALRTPHHLFAMQSSIQTDRQVLRKQLLEKRSHLSAEKQLQASYDLVPIALDIIEKQQADHIAVYLPFKDESSRLV